jgi:outer membrane protein assembly factor BamB
VASADGSRRFRTLAGGRLVAEKRCRRCPAGWRPEWRLQLPGEARAEPLVLGRQVFVGASDARVHCFRAENGHRLWSVDVGDRVALPLATWSGRLGATSPSAMLIELILVVPHAGGALVALDPFDGRRLAALDLEPPEGRLRSPALAIADGRIVVGRERYGPAGYDLLVVDVALAPPPRLADGSAAYGKVPAPEAGR